MPFVHVYRKDTGAIVRVPESHLRIFPEFFSKTPRQKAAEKAARPAPRPVDPSAPTAPTSGADTKE